MSGIDGKKLHLGQYSLSYHIMIVLLVIGMIFISMVFFILYYQEKHAIQSDYLLSQQYGEESLINAVQLADQSFSFYDNVYNQPLRLALLRFREYYNQSHQQAEKMDLFKIRNDIGTFFDLPIDIYIINASGAIEYSTFDTDIGLNFSSYPKFSEKLRKIRDGDTIAYDAIVTGTKLGEERKYAYIPTPDHRYILEIGINLDEFFRKEGISKYPRLAMWYSKTRNDVKSLWIFDRTVLSAPDIRTSIQGIEVYPAVFSEVEGRKEHLKQVFHTKENLLIEDPSSETITKYLYIPQLSSSSVSSGLFDKVAEITYTTTQIRERENSLLGKIILLAVIVILVFLMIVVAITRYITRPVYQIVEDIEKIADGNYDHQIRRTKGFEFRRLESSIQKLVLRLKEDIISIKQKSNELDKELNQRLSAEESLKAANYKLSLLSSITRHDILNQISVVSSGLDILEDDVPRNEETPHYFSLIRDAISNIHEMILFSRIYEEVGVYKPAWQNLSKIIIETKKSLNTGSCKVIDNTGNLEILADPMFDRVIFNLIENVLRHGGKVNQISFDVSMSGDKCILIVSDDGIGISSSDKEKIFDRGFGKNTGLGLFLTREILSLTGILITETGRPGFGTRFEIYMPPGKWRISPGDAVPE
ncbi:sensor histidine kinase [Methanospirillum stamsii]|uniref:histidine kinase n=1 Tax=Methanospirillum stamsii TaxID=1277351 RepID=A0A2V2NK81_9EURY|nr:HAMP domain-containing sensor histidine kinase [Methanospirillum stamsii]PWR76021.1 hypothetical protein DLD82_01640 [Methanospirillum stamsii]